MVAKYSRRRAGYEFSTMTRQFFGTPGADKKSYITICLEQTAAEITADRSGSYYQRAHLSNSSSLKIIATAGCPTFFDFERWDSTGARSEGFS